jgi:hypothetical protein
MEVLFVNLSLKCTYRESRGPNTKPARAQNGGSTPIFHLAGSVPTLALHV